MDLSRRSYETEIMDDLSSQGVIITQTLRELEFINKWLGGNAVTLGALNKIRARLGNGSPVTIADLGCGGGDMLRIVNSWAVRNGIRVNLVGIDANPNIVEYARKNLSDLPNVTFLHADVFSAEFAQMRFDVVIGTLFFHHFTQQQLIQFFAVEGLAFDGALHLDKMAGTRHDDIHIGITAGIFNVIQIEHRPAGNHTHRYGTYVVF